MDNQKSKKKTPSQKELEEQAYDKKLEMIAEEENMAPEISHDSAKKYQILNETLKRQQEKQGKNKTS